MLHESNVLLERKIELRHPKPNKTCLCGAISGMYDTAMRVLATLELLERFESRPVRVRLTEVEFGSWLRAQTANLDCLAALYSHDFRSTRS